MSALPNPMPPPRRPQRSTAPGHNRPRKASVNPIQKVQSVQVQSSAKLWESGAILGVNMVLIGTAIVTLFHLVPYQLSQRAKLTEVRSEESNVARNVQELQQGYERNQSPEAAQRVAQQQGNLMPANQLRVVLMPPAHEIQ